MAELPGRPLDPSTVEQCHQDFAAMLERYAWAIVRDWSLAADVVQAGFIALSRFGGDVVPEARKSWLFRVVHREAVRVRDRQKRYSQPKDADASAVMEAKATYETNPLNQLVDQESIEWMKRRIGELPSEQQTVLRLRIFNEMTFAEIAESLHIPLGTALSRMRLALERLRTSAEDDERI